MPSIYGASDPNATHDEGYKFMSSLLKAFDELDADKIVGHFTPNMTFNQSGDPPFSYTTREATANLFRWLFNECKTLSTSIVEVHTLPERIICVVSGKYTLKSGYESEVRTLIFARKRSKRDSNAVEMYQFDYFGDFAALFQQVRSVRGPFNPEEVY